jgi:hypothetical protein
MVTRLGHLGGGVRVKEQAVRRALFAVSERIAADRGGGDVRKWERGDVVCAPSLTRLMKAMGGQDAPVNHHPPCPVELILEMTRARPRKEVWNTATPASDRVEDLMEFGFLMCCRGGEYACTGRERKVWLKEGQTETIQFGGFVFHAGGKVVYQDGVWDPTVDVRNEERLYEMIQSGSMTLPWQKNGVRDQVVAIARATDDEGRGYEICPLKAAIRIVLSGTRDGMRAGEAIYSVKEGGVKKAVTVEAVQAKLRAMAAAARFAAPGKATGKEKLLSVHSLRSGGAMFYFCANVDTEFIRILGRWKSDAIFSYLSARFPDVMADRVNKAMKHVGGRSHQGGIGGRGYTTVRVSG